MRKSPMITINSVTLVSDTCTLKVCLHIPTQSPSPLECPSKFNIVPMVTGCLTGRMGLEAILPVKLTVTIDTMLNFDGHSDGDGDGVGMCKQALNGDSLSERTPDEYSNTIMTFRQFRKTFFKGQLTTVHKQFCSISAYLFSCDSKKRKE